MNRASWCAAVGVQAEDCEAQSVEFFLLRSVGV
jgi:hypothetical protein